MKDETQTDINEEDYRIRTDDANTRQFLTFRVEQEEYGVELKTVHEIKGWITPTQLPNSPIFMRGVINIRGTVIPIFDLRQRFAMGTTEASKKNVFIIIAVGEKLIGILVDAVSDILTVTEDQIKPAPQVSSNIDDDFVEGLISVKEKMVVILTIDTLFDADTLAQAEKASDESTEQTEEESS